MPPAYRNPPKTMVDTRVQITTVPILLKPARIYIGFRTVVRLESQA